KYMPNWPTKGFESLDSSRRWVEAFVRWYNTEWPPLALFWYWELLVLPLRLCYQLLQLVLLLQEALLVESLVRLLEKPLVISFMKRSSTLKNRVKSL
ncbi:hypothetical protein, partial [Vibrio sp. Hep-1b-8]|uniref:hypothetical protein n=1 Tax=Vibrio sp. Hep-1b-8 TaxID=2144187 RepID=UPI001980C049